MRSLEVVVLAAVVCILAAFAKAPTHTKRLEGALTPVASHRFAHAKAVCPSELDTLSLSLKNQFSLRGKIWLPDGRKFRVFARFVHSKSKAAFDKVHILGMIEAWKGSLSGTGSMQVSIIFLLLGNDNVFDTIPVDGGLPISNRKTARVLVAAAEARKASGTLSSAPADLFDQIEQNILGTLSAWHAAWVQSLKNHQVPGPLTLTDFERTSLESYGFASDSDVSTEYEKYNQCSG